ncbi:MAG: cell wall hydrolase [Bacteroides sp.]
MNRDNTLRIMFCALLLVLGVIILARSEAPQAQVTVKFETTALPTVSEIPEIETPELLQVTEAVNRYSDLSVTEADIETMARLVYLEARGESFAGQRMVAEVVLNRALHEAFPDTVQSVIFQSGQFSPAGLIYTTEPEDEQYEAVRTALAETPITDADVVFFSRAGFNSDIFASVGNHVFCRY